jgi:acetyl esterase/lipase
MLLSVAILTAGPSCRKAEKAAVVQKQLVYKKIGDIELRLDIFEPRGRSRKTPLPAIVLFHGGGWFMGSPDAMHPHCRYFARRQMVAISAQYRLHTAGGALPIQCVEDAKSAVRFVRANAASLAVDLNRIAAGGASAGGHLAVCTAMLDGYEAAEEDKTISCRPNALVLFCPALNTTPRGVGETILAKYRQQFMWMYREDSVSFSPMHNVKKIAAPVLIIHGTADDVVPFETAENFSFFMKRAGNRCDLVPLEAADHSFAVYKQDGDNALFEKAMQEADAFLCEQGFLKK